MEEAANELASGNLKELRKLHVVLNRVRVCQEVERKRAGTLTSRTMRREELDDVFLLTRYDQLFCGKRGFFLYAQYKLR